MQAASRESYAAGLERLDELALQLEPGQIASGADEVLAVADLLRREPRLRRALSDPARTGEERGELFRSLLAGKVGDTALDVLLVLAKGRWSSASQLLDATEQLGAEALLISAEKAGELAEVEDELFRYGQIVNADLTLAATLADATAPLGRRAELVHALLDGKAKAVTIRLAELALAGFGGRGLYASLTRLVELAAERRDRQVAYITVAAPLSEAEEQRLGARLSEMYGREVSLKISVEPNVLGGLSVRVGHDLYDGTVSRRLHDTRTALAGR